MLSLSYHFLNMSGKKFSMFRRDVLLSADAYDAIDSADTDIGCDGGAGACRFLGRFGLCDGVRDVLARESVDNPNVSAGISSSFSYDPSRSFIFSTDGAIGTDLVACCIIFE